MLIKVAAWDLCLYSHQSIWHKLSKRNEVLVASLGIREIPPY